MNGPESAKSGASVARLKSVLTMLLKLGVTAGVLAFIVWKLGWREMVSAAGRADPRWLVAAAGLFYISMVLGVLQWQILLRNRGITLSFGKAYKLYFIGMFFNNFILGMVAGDAVRVTYLRLSNESARAGFAATFFDRFAGFWAMSAFAVTASLWLVRSKGLGPAVGYAALALAAAFFVFAAVMAFLMNRRLQAWAFAVLDRLPLPRKDRIRAVVEEMLLEAHDTHILFPVALLSLVVQALRVGVHITCAAALGLVTLHNIHYFFIIVPFLAMTMVLPLPFGLREGAEGSMFTMAGFHPESSVVMGFLASLVGIAVSLVGAVYFVTSRISRSKEQV